MCGIVGIVDRDQSRSVSDGELQGVVADKVMVSAGGTATVDEMAAVIETMDFKALADF